MKHVKTNVEFVTEFMEYSKHGALAQVFVIEALRVYVEKVRVIAAARRAEVLPDQDPNALISAATWEAIAEELGAKFDANYVEMPASEEQPSPGKME